MRLDSITHWVFDMDGTLTIAMHDFAAIKAQLGLPADEAILESLARLPADQAAAKHALLHEIELDLARRAQPAAGVCETLVRLSRAGHRLGILTRNNRANVEETLAAANLREFFAHDDIVGRDCALPKPSPDGVNRLLARWQAQPTQAAMVGDFRFDLEAGRAAGVTTVLVGPMEDATWQSLCDVHVSDFHELFRLLG